MIKEDRGELIKHMDDEMSKKYQLDKNGLSAEKTAVFNIRKNQKGLYFDIRLYGNENKTIKNLLIPKQFYAKEDHEIKIRLARDKFLLFKHVLVYCAAVLSILVIIDGLMRVVPYIRNFFSINI